KDAGPPRGTRQPGEEPLRWLDHQIRSHADGSDGGLANQAMGELHVEGCYPRGCRRMLTGAEVRRVFARTAAHFHQVHWDNGVEDLASVTLEMEGGLLGSLAIGRIGAASHPDLGEIKIHVLGSAGGLVVSEARPEVAVYHRGQGQPPKEFRHRRVAVDHDYLLMDDFARAVDTGTDTVLGARAGRAICAVVQAAVESGRSGKPVEVRH